MSAFLGIRGTGDWTVEGQRPRHWREALLYLYPNGMAPLTALTSKLTSEKVDDPDFNWYTKTLSHQAATITGVFTASTLASTAAYPAAGGGLAGTTLFVRGSENDIRNFRIGHQVLFRQTTSIAVDRNARVTDRVLAGASSYVACLLLENDATTTPNISNANRLLVIGSINPEHGPMPTAISYDPVRWTNCTQIFRNSLGISRTARLTRLRTGDAYKELKREALEYHAIEMEKAFLWGVQSERIGANGKPERTTRGLIPTIRAAAPANVVDFAVWSAANMANATWNQNRAGELFLDAMMEQLFRHGSREKLAYCGSGALLGINQLAKTSGTFQLSPSTKAYGIQVVEWITAFGKINLVTHPLFSHEPSNRRTMVVFEPKDIKYRYITDTTFYQQDQKQDVGPGRLDGTDEEFLTEAGLEFHHPTGWGYFSNIG